MIGKMIKYNWHGAAITLFQGPYHEGSIYDILLRRGGEGVEQTLVPPANSETKCGVTVSRTH
jgi:hypothetical protein